MTTSLSPSPDRGVPKQLPRWERALAVRPCQPGDVVVSHALGMADWAGIRRFVSRTERHDLRMRFGMPFAFDDDNTLRRMFGVDPNAGEIGWVLDARSEIAGISHRALISPSVAEIALIVRSDLKRTGIGSRLLDCLIRRALSQGLTTLIGLVLWENYAMLQLARKVGFAASEMNGPSVQLELRL